MKTPEDRAKEFGVPLIPRLPDHKPFESNPIVAVCGQCGRDVYQVEGYYCCNSRCPMQTKVIA